MNSFPRNGYELYQTYGLRDSYEKKINEIVIYLSTLDSNKRANMMVGYLKKDLPSVLLPTGTEAIIERNVDFLQNAHIFHSLAVSSQEMIKPILYYYSASLLLDFFVYSLFRIERTSYSHGMKVIDLDRCDDAKICFNDYGFLPRILNAFTIMKLPSAFSPFFITNGTIIKNTDHCACRSNNTITLRELLNTDFGGSNIGYDIRHIILLFAASNFARYNPVSWNRILTGKGTELYLSIQKSYSEFDAIFYKVLASLEFLRKGDQKFFEFLFRHNGEELKRYQYVIRLI